MKQFDDARELSRSTIVEDRLCEKLHLAGRNSSIADSVSHVTRAVTLETQNDVHVAKDLQSYKRGPCNCGLSRNTRVYVRVSRAPKRITVVGRSYRIRPFGEYPTRHAAIRTYETENYSKLLSRASSPDRT
jgi:hypothetical protein